ncbi:MAG: hypothetical protein P8X98_12125 [Woeseiaceae bacterium]|jgi:hypothetical protein
MTRKKIAAGSLKYAALATVGFVLANTFMVEGDTEIRDIAIGALLAFPLAFAFFFAVFSFAWRSKDQD